MKISLEYHYTRMTKNSFGFFTWLVYYIQCQKLVVHTPSDEMRLSASHDLGVSASHYVVVISHPRIQRRMNVVYISHKVSTSNNINNRLVKRSVVAASGGDFSTPPQNEPAAGEESKETQSSGSRTSKSLKQEAVENATRVYDALIDVFRNRKQDEWKKLIVYSTQWPALADGVFARLDAVAEDIENADEQLELRRLKRRLQSVSDMMASHKHLLEEFRSCPSMEWESMVARHRREMGPEFFEYIEIRIRASRAAAAATAENGEEQSSPGDKDAEAEGLAAIGAQLAILVDAYDSVVEDTHALELASESFADLLQSESMEMAEAKLDDLAASGKLDPALLLTMAKAYSGVKETDITKEEVKDIMAHLYFKAKEKFASQAPPEARILKFLLTVESESDRMSLLEQAFQPGAEFSTSNEDYLHTTPAALHNTIENILMMYDSNRGVSGNSMASQASSLMNPEVIQEIRKLKDLVFSKYM